MEDITSVTPTLEKECVKSSTIELAEEIEPIEVIEEIKTVDSVMLNKSSVLKQQKLKLNRKYKNVCLTCNTNKWSIVPMCHWHQDKNYIYMKLNVLELDDFEVIHTMESIKFR